MRIHRTFATHARRAASRVAPVVLAAIACTGCVERRVWIDTDPPGALVWLNDAQLGRTPVDVAITHDGTYDLRIEKEGYEPVVTGATVDGPLWDKPPFDFVCEILPIDARHHTRWRFTLRERDDSEAALHERADAMRGRMQTP